MIPEFKAHDSTYLLWPLRDDNWRDAAYWAQRDVVHLANTISKYEHVKLCHLPGARPTDKWVFEHNNISFLELMYDDIWVRDTGPIFKDAGGQLLATGWEFNSWGGLFSNYENDNLVSRRIADNEQVKFTKNSFVLEGGAIVVDPFGNVISTVDCVLDQARNPNTSLEEAHEILCKGLGVKDILWIPQGLLSDETGGHIDNICFFADSVNLFISVTDDETHESFQRANYAYDRIRKFYAKRYPEVRLHKLPLPDPLVLTEEEARGFKTPDGTISRTAGAKMCASYSNTYVVNGALIVPEFGLPEDKIVKAIFETSMPNIKIEFCPSREFVLGGGGIHCITKEVPKL